MPLTINELNLPILLQGLSDMGVEASPDGVLITHKSTSNRIKSLSPRRTTEPCSKSADVERIGY